MKPGGGDPPKKPEKTPPSQAAKLRAQKAKLDKARKLAKTPPPGSPRGRRAAIRIGDKSGKRSKSTSEEERIKAQAEKDERAKRRQDAITARAARADARHTTEPSSATTLVGARHSAAPRGTPPALPPADAGAAAEEDPEEEEKREEVGPEYREIAMWAQYGADDDRPPVQFAKITAFVAQIATTAELDMNIDVGQDHSATNVFLHSQAHSVKLSGMLMFAAVRHT